MTESPYFLKGHIFACLYHGFFIQVLTTVNNSAMDIVVQDTDFISWLYISSINRLYDSSIFELTEESDRCGRVHLWPPRQDGCHSLNVSLGFKVSLS